MLAGVICGVATAASAQTPTVDPAPSRTDQASRAAPDSNDIVVTAEKRPERVQDVSAQVNVLTAAAIAGLQIRQAPDIVATIPNLTIARTDTYRNSTIVLRSISQANNSDVPVAVIVDGVPQIDPKEFNTRLFDVAQIEVLKGPQGSLYGRNAEAGVILITTVAPTNHFSGSGRISYGKNAQVDATLGISGAIVPDKVLFRLSGNIFRSDGLITNDFRSDRPDYVDHDWNVRGSLRILPADNVTVDLIGRYGDFRAGSTYFTPIFSANANDFRNPREGFPNRAFGHSLFLSGRIEANLGFATVTSITGYSKNNETQITDVDFTNNVQNPTVTQRGDFQPSDSDVFSQEVRVTGSSAARLRWFVGADYLSASKFVSTNIFTDRANYDVDPYGPYLVSNIGRTTRSDYGISGQVDVDLFDRFTLSGGLRYEDSKRQQLNLVNGVRRQVSFDKLQPKVTATYKVNRDVLVYATYAVGHRAGGFNQPNFQIPIFADETLKNFEVGLKSQWFDRKLTVNVALFSGNVTNYQYSYIDSNTASSVTGTIDGVRVRGLEVEARANPVSGLNLFGSIGVSDPKITKSVFPQLIGNATPRARKFTWQAGFDYTTPLKDDLSLVVRANANGFSSTYWFVDNLDIQRPRAFLDANVGITTGNVTVTLWGKNLTNTKANETFFPRQATGNPFYLAYPIKPVSYGVELAYKF